MEAKEKSTQKGGKQTERELKRKKTKKQKK